MPIGYENGLNLLEDWVLHKEPVVHEKRGKVIPLDLRGVFHLPEGFCCMNGLKAGIDISNGMAGLFVKRLLGTDGVFYINEELDGRFPNHPPNPLVPENIRQLQFLVHEEKCDIGIIFDGDADRVMFTDEHGTFISPDLVIALLSSLPERDTRRGAQDIRSSRQWENTWHLWGHKCTHGA